MKKFSFLGLFVIVATVVVFFFFNKNKASAPVSEPVTTVTAETQKIPFSSEKKQNDTTFDIVRVEEDGSSVIAGRGTAGAAVDLMDGDVLLSRLTVDENGEWVFLPTTPLGAGTHELWLKTDASQTRAGSEVVLVSVPEKPAETMVVMLTGTSGDVAVLQAPADAEDVPALNIGSARYLDGRLSVKGKSDAEGTLFLYVNNVFSQKGSVGGDLIYKMDVPAEMTAGKTYVLRVDRTDATGKVVARAEVPFTVGKGVDTSVKIVKGDNLWSIARQVYGSGFDYIAIYRANKNQIKNPDLIYPDQVFVLPSKPVK